MTSPVPEGTDEAVEAAGDALVAYYRAMGMPYRSGIPRPYGAAELAVAAAAPYIAAKALRDYADANHAFGEGAGPTWAGSEPVDAWAACTCGASWAEDGCTEREQLLARADDIERAARAAAGKDKTDG